ncbi:SpoIIE family protein phosphatase [Acetobacterium woodii]|uniref:Protein phosphatase 2C-like protein n=1 Tax=Acetobacterium woodii (strain ATCC 29683 / DSM 1030 / JCM 2381 / KCTC 1655 / WB1) TaxID=931626 RepID=H6LI04_ACEWD|nr:SpoIIE family protein phosphatase [Acetobacterium woodii]AFA48534.1 protein phosphatase 2C-like protein [Acetobacterium woodii DSM 1030]
MKRIEYAMKMRALMGDLSECGDLAYIKEYNNQCFICLIDILGHGNKARSVALVAEEYLNKNFKNNLFEIMEGLHKHLQGSRGGVVLMCHLEIATGKLHYIGIGNINGRIIGIKQNQFISKDGIVGHGRIHPSLKECHLKNRDLLLLCSDGIKEHYNIIDHVQLFSQDTESIVTGILCELGKKDDDASCIALRYLE